MPPDPSDEEPVVLTTFAPGAPLGDAGAVRATVLLVCEPSGDSVCLLAVGLQDRPGLVAAHLRALPGCLSAHVRRARPAPPLLDPAWTRVRARYPASDPLEYWLAPPPLPMPVVSVLVLRVAPGTPGGAVRDASHPAPAFPDGSGRWILVDPPPEAARTVRSASWCRDAHTASAVAVLADAPDLAPVLGALACAARQTITVADPDFGPVTYALFSTEAAALAVLAGFEC